MSIAPYPIEIGKTTSSVDFKRKLRSTEVQKREKRPLLTEIYNAPELRKEGDYVVVTS